MNQHNAHNVQHLAIICQGDDSTKDVEPFILKSVIDLDGLWSKPRSLVSSYIIVDNQPTLLEQNQSLPDWFQIDQILH